MRHIGRVALIFTLAALTVGLLFPAGASAWYSRCSPTPFITDIAVKNMYCKTAKRYIRNWYHHGKPMPARWNCRLQSGVRSRCRYKRKSFAFRFSE